MIQNAVVAILLNERGEVLMAKHKKTGLYSFPGGKIDLFESSIDAVLRELKEETGYSWSGSSLKISTEDEISESSHCITQYFLVPYFDTIEIENKEPDKHSSWEWFSWNNLPGPTYSQHIELANHFSLGVLCGMAQDIITDSFESWVSKG